MSKVNLFAILVSLMFFVQAGLLLAEDYTDFNETTYDDANWVLVTCDILLRANTCIDSDEGQWYEKVFNPCEGSFWNSYWKFAQGATTGRAFTIEEIEAGSTDSLYVPEGFGFQLYDANSEPFGPYRGGARYVSLEHWRYTVPPPDGFEPGTLFVPGSEGGLELYSIIVARYPLRLSKTHNADANGVSQEEFFTYQISYENDANGLSDPNDPNSGPQDANDLIIVDLLPIELDFNSASDGGSYDANSHTVTWWNIGDLSIGSSGSVELSVKVNRYAIPGAIITNYCEIKNDLLSAGAAVDVNVLYKPPLMKLQKDDDLGPSETVLPDSNITYTISYDANDHNLSDVDIIDYLPEEVSNFPNDVNFSEPNGAYDPVTHTVTWHIGTVSVGDSNSVTVTVKVNDLAEPLGVITNFCKIETDSSYISATVDTNVGSWNPGIVYVNADKRTTWSNTGMSWKNAYLDLQDAHDRAGAGCGSEIWVARGTYKPTKRTNPSYPSTATFQLVDGVPIYGGFAGYESSLAQRNWITNQTVLDGRAVLSYVVTASDVNATAIVDGFRIRNGTWSGIYTNNGSPTITNCEIAGNYDGVCCTSGSSVNIADCNVRGSGRYGIYCNDSNLIASNCIVLDSDNHGIYCYDADETKISNCTIKQNGKQNGQCGIYSLRSSLDISHCLIKDNGDDGIYCHNSALMVTNSIIEDNEDNGIYNKASTDDGSLPGIVTNNIIRRNSARGIHFYYIWPGEPLQIINNWIHNNARGIYIQEVDESVLIRNNTVADNSDYGIVRDAGDAGPDLTNCIVWGNTTGSLSGDFNSITYSCIENGGTTNGNINSDPCFVNDVNDNYHISPDSNCIDAGNTALITDTNETDLDTEPRVWDGDFNDTDEVDIGADEVYYSPADFDANNIVNFIDYAMFADTWMLSPSDSNYNADCNLTGPNSIDNNDLDRFCDEWLWEPAWTKNAEEMMMMRAGATTYMTATLDSASATAIYTPTPDQLLKFQPPQLDIEETIKWLEYLWFNDPVLRENIDEKQWLEFIKAIEHYLKDFLH